MTSCLRESRLWRLLLVVGVLLLALGLQITSIFRATRRTSYAESSDKLSFLVDGSNVLVEISVRSGPLGDPLWYQLVGRVWVTSNADGEYTRDSNRARELELVGYDASTGTLRAKDPRTGEETAMVGIWPSQLSPTAKDLPVRWLENAGYEYSVNRAGQSLVISSMQPSVTDWTALRMLIARRLAVAFGWGFGAYVLGLIVAGLVALRRGADGLCEHCGYDLRGLAHERCPECGAEHKN